MDVAATHGFSEAESPLGGVYRHIGSSSTVLRVGVGSLLRRHREAAKISRDVAAETLRAQPSKISRMELGRVSLKRRDVADLLTLYGITDPVVRDDILELAERANEPGWWQSYGDAIPDWFKTYLNLERAASVIRTYDILFVPTLLQTEAYARAVISLAWAPLEDAKRREQIERQVALRMQRQRSLTEENPPNLWAIVDELALHRRFGGPGVLRDQLDHLMDLNLRRNITLQIAPPSYVRHPSCGHPFSILRFSQFDLPDVVYLEQLTGAIFIDDVRKVDPYAVAMNQLATGLRPPETTAAALASIRNHIPAT